MAEAKKMKNVGIIGAGPSGLIAAHHLLKQPDVFTVTIFEKTHQACGLWPQVKSDDQRMIDPYMRSNQSRHTVQFGSIGQKFYEKDKEQWDADVDVFPNAWQVGRYLGQLCDAVTTAGAELRLNTEVVSVVKVDDGLKNGELMKWRVTTRKTVPPQDHPPVFEEEMGRLSIGNEEEHIFDHLIIASGFFGTPKIPAPLQSWVSTPVGEPSNAADISSDGNKTFSLPLGIPVIHSSSFRSLKGLLNVAKTNGSIASAFTPGTSRRILVVGGSMSGAEVASSIASELSSNQNSPGAVPISNQDDYEIIHVTDRPFWTLPRYLPLNAEDEAPQFLPLDMVLFNLVNRPDNTLATNRAGAIDEDQAKRAHAYYASLSGQVKPHAWIDTDKETDAPWLAICDDYTTHSLCGNICTFRGRLTSLHPATDSSPSVSATITTPSGEMSLDNIAAVILATGFTSKNSLEFMSEKMKQKLEYEPESYAPMYLSWQSAISPSLPTLGFVGMYNGPFWGVMEQQAILLATAWAQMDGDPDARLERENEEYERLEEEAEYIQDLGRHVKYAGTLGPWQRIVEEQEGRERLTQFPMGDYIHVIFDMLSLRGKRISKPPQGVVCWPLIPDSVEGSAYHGLPDDSTISPARKAVQTVVDEGLAGKFYPRTLFRALLGNWKLERTIVSKHPSYPSGTMSGAATFHPRKPTDDSYSGEYLYDEAGDFKTDSGFIMKASRRYVWRLEPGKEGARDKISQWFVMVRGENKDKGVDYLFHELDIIRPDGTPLSAEHGLNAAACPRTAAPIMAADDEEVRGGWASKPAVSSFSSLTSCPLPQTVKSAANSRTNKEEGKDDKKFWKAKGHHLCIDDTYDPEYTFKWRGSELKEWTMAYTVRGPGKDYWIHSKFTRQVWD